MSFSHLDRMRRAAFAVSLMKAPVIGWHDVLPLVRGPHGGKIRVRTGCKRDRYGWVYIGRRADGEIKIGQGQSPDHRLRIQGLEPLALIEDAGVRGERALHQNFRGERTAHEFFRGPRIREFVRLIRANATATFASRFDETRYHDHFAQIEWLVTGEERSDRRVA